MSEKKVKQHSLFRNCSKCGICLLSFALEEHLSSMCAHIFPCITERSLHIKLAKLPSASKILNMSIMKTKYSNSIIFLPEELMNEASFMTYGWVHMKCYNDCKSNETEQADNEVAFRVWPIPSDGSGLRGESKQAFLTLDGFLVHPTFNPNQTVTLIIPDIQISPFTIFPSAEQIVIDIGKSILNINNAEGDMDEKFVKVVRSALQDRIVAERNIFQVKFYAELVPFTVDQIISYPLNHCVKSSHHEITSKTKIKALRHQDILEDEMSSDYIGPNDIGGVGAKAIMKEMCSTISCVINSQVSDALRGILLYGHHGTGKSLLVQAVCNFMGLHVVLYQNQPILLVSPKPRLSICKSLHETFNEAVLRAPCAVVIDNMETLDSQSDGSGSETIDSSWNLSTSLRAQFDRLDSLHAKVVVLGITSDLDSIDPNYRSTSLFGRELEMPIPTTDDREDILLEITRSMKHTLTSEHIKLIAGNTHGFVGADIRALCNEASLLAVRHRQEYSFNMKDIEICMKTVRPSAMKGFLIEVPNVKWSDIGGQEDLKFKLKQAIEWPRKHPESFARMGITPPKGFLMYGPPGCSKTMIAKAVATESGLNFISVKGSEIFSKWVGESEKAIQSLFRKAREVSPSILFFDEIDSVGGERGNSSSSGTSVNERVLSQLLVEMDGIESLKDVTIIAATNRPDIIDQALIRPGRLDRIIYVPLPDPETRKDIFRIRFKKMPVHINVDTDRLVTLTLGYSGAEITAVCQEAALKALEEDIKSDAILEKHFMEALKIVKPRISREQIEFYESYSKRRLII